MSRVVRKTVWLFGEFRDQPEASAFLRWIDRHPAGFVANVKIPEQHIMVHVAACPWGQGASWGNPTLTNIKVAALTENRLSKTVEHRWPETPVYHCGHCIP